MRMTTVRQLTTVGEWEEALRRSHERPLLVFKHSTRCSVSAGAHEALHRYLADARPTDCEVAIVHVVEDRPVSNAVAESTGIKHESPQAILIRDGKPVWHASHWTITYEFLCDKLGRPAESPPSGQTT